ncbi:MAG: hypothetical protein BWY99_02665 [Synergistetes bacterium ADurb.BinA166]|nr:MAG: hypothetical protein BWY99_02665 [Synergistetes bacterium ADurb.BinA166]
MNASLVVAEHVVRWSKVLLVELVSLHGKKIGPVTDSVREAITALERASDQIVALKHESTSPEEKT